ncbi:MAG: inositol monophosphatase family protein [Anaerolineae bacterium]
MSHERYASWLETAVRLVRRAGTELRRRWTTQHTVKQKGFRNIVTEADVAAEAVILKGLRAAYPEHAITSEEAGADPLDRRVRWFVDPLDGTTNFSRHNPNFCVSLAALEAGRPVVGVVYDPLRDHCFAAVAGGGATLNGAAIHTSGRTAVAEMVFATDWPRAYKLRKRHAALIVRLLTEARTLRCLGSAALNIAYVAAGWFDLFLAQHLSAWDQAAALLLVQEAGGSVQTLSGVPWTSEARDPLIGATSTLVTACRTMIREEVR